MPEKGSPLILSHEKNLSLLRDVSGDFMCVLLGDFNTLTYESIKFKLLYGADTLVKVKAQIPQEARRSIRKPFTCLCVQFYYEDIKIVI